MAHVSKNVVLATSIIVAGLSGCDTQPANTPQCQEETLMSLIGQHVSVLDVAEQEKFGPIRIIRPNEPVGLSLNNTRTNISVDGADVIQSLDCY